MILFGLLLGLCAGAAAPAHAAMCTGDGSWFWLNPTPHSHAYWGLSFVDANNGWAVVSNDGIVTHTTDGGATWSTQLSVRGSWFADVEFSTRWQGCVVGSEPTADGERGVIYRTVDGGVTWRRTDVAASPWLSRVAFADRLHGWAVGGNGVILSTADGGVTWKRRVSPSATDINGVGFVSATKGWICTNGGEIYATTTGGADPDGAGPRRGWTQQSREGSASLDTFCFASASEGWCVGRSGTVLHTTTGGADPDGAGPRVGWELQPSPAGDNIRDIAAADSETLWTVDQGGGICMTTTGGADPDGAGPQLGWTAQTSGTAAQLYVLHVTSATVAQAGGDYGTWLSTANGGSTWSQTGGGRESDPMFGGIDFVSPTVGVVVGYTTGPTMSTIRRTTDGGATWDEVWTGTDKMLRGVDMATDEVGWAVGPAGVILKTGDGGATWSTETSPGGYILQAVSAVDATHAWAVGTNGAILATSNGSDWALQWNGPGTMYITAIDMATLLEGWAVTDGGELLHTTTGGVDPDGAGPLEGWTAVTSPTSRSLKDVCFVSASTGWIVGGAWDDATQKYIADVYCTTNSGASWQKQNPEMSSSLGALITAVAFSDVDHGWVMGNYGYAACTSDGGQTWKEMNSGASYDFARCLAMVDDTHAWAAGDSGLLLGTQSFDAVPPVTKVTKAVGLWHNHAVTVYFGAADGAGCGVRTIKTKLGSGPWVTGGRRVLAAPATHRGDGLKTISYRASDWDNNVEKSRTVKVGIDTRRPVTVAPSPASVVRGAYAILRYKVTDAAPNGGSAKVTIRIQNARGVTVATLNLGTKPVNRALSARFRCVLARGSYRFSVLATDRAGNRQRVTGWNRLTVR